jgi:hypothetical protein
MMTPPDPRDLTRAWLEGWDAHRHADHGNVRFYCPYCCPEQRGKRDLSAHMDTGEWHCFKPSCDARGLLVEYRRGGERTAPRPRPHQPVRPRPPEKAAVRLIETLGRERFACHDATGQLGGYHAQTKRRLHRMDGSVDKDKDVLWLLPSGEPSHDGLVHPSELVYTPRGGALQDWPDDAWIAGCEGESAAQALDRLLPPYWYILGFVCGADGHPAPAIVAELARGHTVFWADNDRSGKGQALMRRAGAGVLAHGGAARYFAPPPECPGDGDDAANFEANGGAGGEALAARLRNAPSMYAALRAEQDRAHQAAIDALLRQIAILRRSPTSEDPDPWPDGADARELALEAELNAVYAWGECDAYSAADRWAAVGAMRVANQRAARVTPETIAAEPDARARKLLQAGAVEVPDVAIAERSGMDASTAGAFIKRHGPGTPKHPGRDVFRVPKFNVHTSEPDPVTGKVKEKTTTRRYLYAQPMATWLGHLMANAPPEKRQHGGKREHSPLPPPCPHCGVQEREHRCTGCGATLGHSPPQPRRHRPGSGIGKLPIPLREPVPPASPDPPEASHARDRETGDPATPVITTPVALASCQSHPPPPLLGGLPDGTIAAALAPTDAPPALPRGCVAWCAPCRAAGRWTSLRAGVTRCTRCARPWRPPDAAPRAEGP